jgi:electron transfer flavoprotein alpha subunit
MPGLWAIAELVDGAPTRLSAELATLARQLGDAGGIAATTVVIGQGAAAAARALAAHGPDVIALELDAGGRPWAAPAAEALAGLVAERAPDWILVGATPDGKDLAGALVGLTELPILVNASAVTWSDGGPEVAMSVFGGRLATRSSFDGARGIVLVRPASVSAEEAATPGSVEEVRAQSQEPVLADVRVLDHVDQAAAAASIEEARVIVGGGRGVGGPDGFRVIEDLADALGAAVAATRAAVDAGWIGYSQQIGQTGKTVKPDLYVACGISGAIQHKVGVQTAGTIVAVNRDPDAPIAEFADLMVVGDLFQIVPRLAAAIRERRAGNG